MNENYFKIFAIGDSGLTVCFGNEISLELNRTALQIAESIEQNPFLGFVEIVPAYSSFSVFYNLVEVRKRYQQFPTAFEAVKSFCQIAAFSTVFTSEDHDNLVEIPVNFSRKHALDLGFVAESNNLSEKEIIDIFTSSIYQVFFLGFLPGFAYLGEVDERIATPRREIPRTKVPSGSVGIAGRQTGIYPLDSPGGWQIIGKTELELFTPEADLPTFLQPGDLVKFVELK
jgi:inhibitor of KinA